MKNIKKKWREKLIMKSRSFKEVLTEFKDRLMKVILLIFSWKIFFERLKPISTMSSLEMTFLFAGLLGIVYFGILLIISFISIIILIIIKILKIKKKGEYK
ncbi:hypothetical protein JMUB5056_1016 [Leptotrichia hongkongensis]|jgi:hypothetical protein|uniref:Uncharacterized protein n=1 Tax=Leptotrichia hongkongensis TaxID=554406 RepID=A0A510L628_9FUSO|nr:hypothetical protein [Leptotrichia hongkongensis]BBM59432.1 hypothetical protein JMUB5056_1016 [Leptotrichia hongkongensis]